MQGIQGPINAQGLQGTQGLQGLQGISGFVAGAANQIIYKDATNVATGSDNLKYTGATNIFALGGTDSRMELNGTTSNLVNFNASGVAAPAFTTRSVGTKLVLFPNVGASTVDYGFGIENNTLWSSVPDSAKQFKWYAGTTNIATLSGTGDLTVKNLNITGITTSPGGINPGNTQGYPDYGLLLDFQADLAGTWRRIVNATLANVDFSTIGFKIEITDPQANNATIGSVDNVRTETYYVACVRTESLISLGANVPDACYVRGPGNRIRAVKTATGIYQIQIQNDFQYREYRINISVYTVNGTHTVTYHEGDAASNGTVQYYASVSTISKALFQNIGIGTASSAQYKLTVAGPNATVSTTLNNVLAQFTSNVAGLSQINFRNSNAGTTAASSIVVSTNDGSDAANNIAMGILNSAYNTTSWTLSGPRDGYLYTSEGNLSIGAASAKYVSFFTGGTVLANERMRILSGGDVGIGLASPTSKLHVSGDIKASNQLISLVATGTPPISVLSTSLVTNLNADLLDGKNTGTSGSTIPVLDANNTWSNQQNFTNSIFMNSSASERQIVFNNATTNVYYYGQTVAGGGGFGMYDGTNSRGIYHYSPSLNTLAIGRTVSFDSGITGLALFRLPAGNVGSNTGQVANLQLYQPTAGTDAFLTFHIAADYAMHFGLDGTTNDLFVGGWSAGAVKNKVWHEGNDGPTSGLAADSARSATYLNSNVSAIYYANINNRATVNSGFAQTSNVNTSNGWPITATNGYCHLITSVHDNTANYYAMQLASPFFDDGVNGGQRLFFRSVQSNTTTAGTSWSEVTMFAKDTTLLFYQSAAPTGWTKVTTQDNKALRVVSGTTGGTASSGGSNFTTIFASNRLVPLLEHGHPITDKQHSHLIYGKSESFGTGSSDQNAGDGTSLNWNTSLQYTGITATENNGSPNASMDFAVQYIDVILCKKN